MRQLKKDVHIIRSLQFKPALFEGHLSHYAADRTQREECLMASVIMPSSSFCLTILPVVGTSHASCLARTEMEKSVSSSLSESDFSSGESQAIQFSTKLFSGKKCLNGRTKLWFLTGQPFHVDACVISQASFSVRTNRSWNRLPKQSQSENQGPTAA